MPFFIDLARKDSFISLKDGYIEFHFALTHNAAPHDDCVTADDLRLVSSASFSLFSENQLNSSIGRHLEPIEYAHAVCLIYKIIPSSRDTNNLWIRFDGSKERCEEEMTNNDESTN